MYYRSFAVSTLGHHFLTRCFDTFARRVFAKLFLASPPTIRRRVAFIILVVLSDSVWSGMLYTLMADILTRHILHSALTMTPNTARGCVKSLAE